MVVKTLIIAVILVTIVMLALGIKLLFDKNASFTVHSCGLDDADNLNKEGACLQCHVKDIDECPQKKDNTPDK